MTLSIKARFTDGVLTPLEPIDLEDGAEVTLRIENGSQDSEVALEPENGQMVAPNTASLIQMFEELRGSVSDDGWDNLPTDLSKNIDHYLYGAPKESDS